MFWAWTGWGLAAALGVLTLWLGVRGRGTPQAETLPKPDQAPEDDRLEKLQALHAQLAAAGLMPSEQRAALDPFEHDPERHAALLAHEAALAEAAGAHAERIWAGIAEGRYFQPAQSGGARPGVAAMLAELYAAAQTVAQIFQAPPAPIGATMGAVRDAAGQLLERAAAVPFVDLPGWTMDDLARRLGVVERARQGWQVAGPYVRAAVWTHRFMRGLHPVWQVAGGALESAAARWTERHLAGLVEAVVALVYVHLARASVPDLTRYTLDACALEEVLRVHAAGPGIDPNRQRLLAAILAAPLPDEAHRRHLLRLLTADAAPGGVLPDYRTLSTSARRALATRLTELLAELHGLADPRVRDVLTGIEHRLGHGLALDYLASAVSVRFRARAGLLALAEVARTRLEISPAEAIERLRETPFASEVTRWLPDGADAELEAAVEAAYDGTGEPSVPRALCGDVSAGAWCDSLVQLLDRAPGPWCAGDDELALVALMTLLPSRADFDKRWRNHLGRARARLREARRTGTLEVPDAATARLVLRSLPGGAVLVDATFADAVNGEERRKRSHWVAFVEGSVLFGRVPPEGDWLADVEVTRAAAADVVSRRLKGITSDDLELLACGQRLVVEGVVSATFRARFQPVLAATGLRLSS